MGKNQLAVLGPWESLWKEQTPRGGWGKGWPHPEAKCQSFFTFTNSSKHLRTWILNSPSLNLQQVNRQGPKTTYRCPKVFIFTSWRIWVNLGPWSVTKSHPDMNQRMWPGLWITQLRQALWGLPRETGWVGLLASSPTWPEFCNSHMTSTVLGNPPQAPRSLRNPAQNSTPPPQVSLQASSPGLWWEAVLFYHWLHPKSSPCRVCRWEEVAVVLFSVV